MAPRGFHNGAPPPLRRNAPSFRSPPSCGACVAGLSPPPPHAPPHPPGSPAFGTRGLLVASPASAELLVGNGCVDNGGAYYALDDCEHAFNSGLLASGGLQGALRAYIQTDAAIYKLRTAELANGPAHATLTLTSADVYLHEQLGERFIRAGIEVSSGGGGGGGWRQGEAQRKPRGCACPTPPLRKEDHGFAWWKATLVAAHTAVVREAVAREATAMETAVCTTRFCGSRALRCSAARTLRCSAARAAVLRGSRVAVHRGSRIAVLRGSRVAVLCGSHVAVLRGSHVALHRGSRVAMLRSLRSCLATLPGAWLCAQERGARV